MIHLPAKQSAGVEPDMNLFVYMPLYSEDMTAYSIFIM